MRGTGELTKSLFGVGMDGGSAGKLSRGLFAVGVDGGKEHYCYSRRLISQLRTWTGRME